MATSKLELALRTFDAACVGFYVVDALFIGFLSSQVVLPEAAHPEWARDIVAWYVRELKDPLWKDPPDWFKVQAAVEIVLQIPYFLFALIAWWRQQQWIRGPAILYGTHVTTMYIPVLATIYFEVESDWSKLLLTAWRLPFILFPLFIVLRFGLDAQPYIPIISRNPLPGMPGTMNGSMQNQTGEEDHGTESEMTVVDGGHRRVNTEPSPSNHTPLQHVQITDPVPVQPVTADSPPQQGRDSVRARPGTSYSWA